MKLKKKVFKNYLFTLKLDKDVINIFKTTPNLLEKICFKNCIVCTEDDVITIKAIHKVLSVCGNLGINKKAIKEDILKLHPSLYKSFSKLLDI